MDLIVTPVMDNAAQGIDFARRQLVGEEVADEELDTIGHGRALDMSTSEWFNAGQIEHGSAEVRPSFAGGNGEVACGAAEIDEVLERAEIEGARETRRCQLTETVHGADETGRRGVIAEVVIEKRLAAAKRLSPAIRSLPDGIVQVRPEQKQ